MPACSIEPTFPQRLRLRLGKASPRLPSAIADVPQYFVRIVEFI